MRFRLYALLACTAAAMTVAACSEDPTSAGTGEPSMIVTSRSLTNQVKNVAFNFTAYTIDKNDQRMAGKLDAVSAGSAVRVDSAIYELDLLQTRVYVTPVASSTAGTIITVSGHNLSKDVTVVVP